MRLEAGTGPVETTRSRSSSGCQLGSILIAEGAKVVLSSQFYSERCALYSETGGRK